MRLTLASAFTVLNKEPSSSVHLKMRGRSIGLVAIESAGFEHVGSHIQQHTCFQSSVRLASFGFALVLLCQRLSAMCLAKQAKGTSSTEKESVPLGLDCRLELTVHENMTSTCTLCRVQRRKTAAHGINFAMRPSITLPAYP